MCLCMLTGVRAQGRYDGARHADRGSVSGKITSSEGEAMDFVTVYLKHSSFGGITNAEGVYHIKAPQGVTRLWLRLWDMVR